MMIPILLVDDDVNLLSGIRRQLKGKYDLVTAESGKEGLDYIIKGKKFQVVLTDFKMPVMDGVAFLAEVKKQSPDSVCMMLTGQADMNAVIDVINKGNIFRFLTKPCLPDLLQKNIEDGISQYNLIQAERELLTRTLGGALQVMTDMLVLAKPQAFNRGQRVREVVKKLLLHMKVENIWQIEIAAMLSQIGCVTVPDAILDKMYRNQPLPPEDKIIFLLHTKTSSDIIRKIPRLEKVADIICYQEKYYNGSGFPGDPVKGENIPLGARILRVALDYDQLLQTNLSSGEAIEAMKKRKGWYDEKIVDILVLSRDEGAHRKFILKEVKIDDLTEDMSLADEIKLATGTVIGIKNQKINRAFIITLKNYFQNKEIIEPVSVYVFSD